MRTGCQGVVVSFDSPIGMGVVRENAVSPESVVISEGALGQRAGLQEFAFHCTQIADGSREIIVGTPVVFDVVAAGPGRWEAANLRVVMRP